MMNWNVKKSDRGRTKKEHTGDIRISVPNTTTGHQRYRISIHFYNGTQKYFGDRYKYCYDRGRLYLTCDDTGKGYKISKNQHDIHTSFEDRELHAIFKDKKEHGYDLEYKLIYDRSEHAYYAEIWK